MTISDQMEQQLAAGLRERQIPEFVKHDEIEPRQSIGDAPPSRDSASS